MGIKRGGRGNPGLVNGRIPSMPDMKEPAEEDGVFRGYCIVGALVAACVFGLGVYAAPVGIGRAHMAGYLCFVGCVSIVMGSVWPLVLVGGAILGAFYGLTYLVM